MWLINARSLQLESFEGDKIPKYAILSHRWEGEEVSFKDMRKQRVRDGKGYRKIQACCKQALADGLKYAWVDTCCIDKSSSAELSEAINSMFRWYKNSKVCYAFLYDISSQSFTTSTWFTRGWTLQELLAPSKVIFFDSTWKPIGSKVFLVDDISYRTGIERRAVENFVPARYCVAEKMKWAANRFTTRVEDRAYSLLGLFQINMPLLYGEAENAFSRLQREIMDNSNDISIFFTSQNLDKTFGMLGTAPGSFDFDDFGSPTTYQHAFTCTKHGVNITCSLHRYALDIYILDLGAGDVDRGAKAVHLFVRWNFIASKFQRVAVDGRYHYLTGTRLGSRDFDYAGTHEINIGRLPIAMVSSTSLPFDQWKQYLTGTHNLSISPGSFSVIPTNGVEFHGPKLFIDHQSRSDTRQCLGIEHKTNKVASALEPNPIMFVHFGLNINGDPTAFVTGALDQATVDGFPISLDCMIDGYGSLAEFSNIPPYPLNHQHAKPICIDDLNEIEHKIVEINNQLRFHFVWLPEKGKNWRIFIDNSAPFISTNASLLPKSIPDSWYLPTNKMIIR